MKTSILIPSLDADYLNDLLPQITGPDREIVVCSPYEPPATCVWVKDTKLAGNNPATRMAFQRSTGDVIVCMSDDITISPGWLEEGLRLLEDEKCIVSLAPLENSLCFGLLYANFPMCRRDTVIRHWEWFYPYQAHWGDPSFSLKLWQSGGKIVATKPLVAYRQRDGHPEAPSKSSSFDLDCMAFLNDFGLLSRLWMIENWRLFNHAEPKP
jgi:hypothetical protein